MGRARICSSLPIPAMPTYVYESISESPGEAVERFEFQQPIAAPPLTRHPESGKPIRRIITAGAGLVLGAKRSAPVARRVTRACGCGPGCGCGR